MSLPNMQTISWLYKEETKSYDIENTFQKNNVEVIKSEILIRLNSFKGEWVPDPDFGISGNQINQNGTNPDIIVQLIIDEILKVENVNSAVIKSTFFDSSSRLLNATFDVNTKFGLATVQKVF